MLDHVPGLCIMPSPCWHPSCTLMQLRLLYLGANKLVGSIPESWSALITVSRCCKALQLLTDVVAAPAMPTMSVVLYCQIKPFNLGYYTFWLMRVAQFMQWGAALHAFITLQSLDPKAPAKAMYQMFIGDRVICYATPWPKALWCLENQWLVQLEELVLSSNALEGSLPESLGNLTSVSLVIALMRCYYFMLLMLEDQTPGRQCWPCMTTMSSQYIASCASHL